MERLDLVFLPGVFVMYTMSDADLGFICSPIKCALTGVVLSSATCIVPASLIFSAILSDVCRVVTSM